MMYIKGDAVATTNTIVAPADDNMSKMIANEPYEINNPTATSAIAGISQSGQTKLTRLKLDEVVSLPDNFLGYANNLEEIYLPKCKTFGNYSICGLNNTAGQLAKLTSWDNVTLSNQINNIGKRFMSGSNLDRIELGDVTAVGYCFAEFCPRLEYVKFDSLNSFNFTYENKRSSFYQCPNLKIVDFGVCTQFLGGHQTYSFNGCTNIKAIVLRRTNAVTTLRDATAFQWLKDNVQGWYFYVPDDLVDTYKNATMWSTWYADYIKPLSEYNKEEILGGGE